MTFIINGINLKSHLQADSMWMEVGLLIDRIVEEHKDEYKAVRLLKLVIELRDTLKQRHGKQITVNISNSSPEELIGKGQLVMGYIL